MGCWRPQQRPWGPNWPFHSAEGSSHAVPGDQGQVLAGHLLDVQAVTVAISHTLGCEIATATDNTSELTRTQHCSWLAAACCDQQPGELRVVLVLCNGGLGALLGPGPLRLEPRLHQKTHAQGGAVHTLACVPRQGGVLRAGSLLGRLLLLSWMWQRVALLQ